MDVQLPKSNIGIARSKTLTQISKSKQTTERQTNKRIYDFTNTALKSGDMNRLYIGL